MGGPVIMLLELFPFLRGFDFLFGNPIQRLQTLCDKMNGMVSDVSEFLQFFFAKVSIRSNNVN